jgi:hypothetical protein
VMAASAVLPPFGAACESIDTGGSIRQQICESSTPATASCLIRSHGFTASHPPTLPGAYALRS